MKQFIIVDNTSNTGRNYIDANGDNVALEENACKFNSVRDAEDFARGLVCGTHNWFCVIETDYEKDYSELKKIHEKIRKVLIDNGCEEYGDCIIDEICNAVGILGTTVYYEEGQ